MSNKWSNEKISKFLEIYEKYDVLWDIENNKYRDRNTREENLKKLVKEINDEGLNADVEEVRKKIKMIKTVYSEELRKIEKSRKSGSGTDEVYNPKLSWFGIANTFLRNVTATRKSTSNLETSMDANEEEIEAESLVEHEGAPLMTPKRKKTNKLMTLPLKPPKEKKTSSIERVEGAIRDLHCIAEATSSMSTDNEFDYFGKYISSSLKNLPAINALRCQEKIQKIITEERIAVLSQTQARAPPEKPLYITTANPSFTCFNSPNGYQYSTATSPSTSSNSSYFPLNTFRSDSNTSEKDIIQIALEDAANFD